MVAHGTVVKLFNIVSKLIEFVQKLLLTVSMVLENGSSSVRLLARARDNPTTPKPYSTLESICRAACEITISIPFERRGA